MEILRYKRAQMLVVNLFAAFSCIAQISLEGSYFVSNFPETSIRFNFNKNLFTITSSGNFGSTVVNKGYFFLHNDTVVLAYDNPVIEEFSVIYSSTNIDSLGESSYLTSLSFDIVNSVRNPGIIMIRDKYNQNIKAVSFPESGDLKLLFEPHTKADNLLFTFLDNELIFHIGPYFGKTSIININLPESSNYKPGKRVGLEKYVIKNRLNNSLEMKKIGTDQLLKLRKRKE